MSLASLLAKNAARAAQSAKDEASPETSVGPKNTNVIALFEKSSAVSATSSAHKDTSQPLSAGDSKTSTNKSADVKSKSSARKRSRPDSDDEEVLTKQQASKKARQSKKESIRKSMESQKQLSAALAAARSVAALVNKDALVGAEKSATKKTDNKKLLESKGEETSEIARTCDR
jgi:hypothetical protein